MRFVVFVFASANRFNVVFFTTFIAAGVNVFGFIGVSITTLVALSSLLGFLSGLVLLDLFDLQHVSCCYGVLTDPRFFIFWVIE